MGDRRVQHARRGSAAGSTRSPRDAECVRVPWFSIRRRRRDRPSSTARTHSIARWTSSEHRPPVGSRRPPASTRRVDASPCGGSVRRRETALRPRGGIAGGRSIDPWSRSRPADGERWSRAVVPRATSRSGGRAPRRGPAVVRTDGGATPLHREASLPAVSDVGLMEHESGRLDVDRIGCPATDVERHGVRARKHEDVRSVVADRGSDRVGLDRTVLVRDPGEAPRWSVERTTHLDAGIDVVEREFGHAAGEVGGVRGRIEDDLVGRAEQGRLPGEEEVVPGPLVSATRTFTVRSEQGVDGTLGVGGLERIGEVDPDHVLGRRGRTRRRRPAAGPRSRSPGFGAPGLEGRPRDPR